MLAKIAIAGVLLVAECLPCTVVAVERRIWSKDRDSTSKLFAFEKGSLVGFIDSSGSIVIAPRIPARIEDVSDFSDGRAVVQHGARPGYIDESGIVVIASDRIGAFSLLPFSEGLGASVDGRKTFYIDRSGSTVFELPGSRGTTFREGLAVYRWRPKPLEYDRDSLTPPPPPTTLGIGPVGYVDRQGSVAIEPQFAAAGPFVDGLARVVQDGQCFVQESSGRRLATPTTGTRDSCGGPPPGVDAVCPTGFIDKTGAYVIPPKFDSALDFSEGLAAVKIGRLWGFVDRSGTLVVKPQFSGARQFHDGRAAVLKGRKWAFIDTSGEFVVPALWDEAGDFSEGFAAVSNAGQYSYIDQSGSVAIPGPYLEATHFVQGLAAVRIEEHRINYITKDGTVVFEYSRDKHAR